MSYRHGRRLRKTARDRRLLSRIQWAASEAGLRRIDVELRIYDGIWWGDDEQEGYFDHERSVIAINGRGHRRENYDWTALHEYAHGLQALVIDGTGHEIEDHCALWGALHGILYSTMYTHYYTRNAGPWVTAPY